MDHVLDRPVWTALTTRQARLGLGDARARRYRPEINLFAATADGAGADLAGLLVASSPIGTVEPVMLAAAPGLRCVSHRIVNQMVSERSPPGRRDQGAGIELGSADGAEMLALATLTEPGPFHAETWRMGRFVGVRAGGRLIAMAGERMQAPGFTEVSAVCTHPDHRGRGLAGMLIRQVIQRIVRDGDAAFLHVYPDNHGAIALYEALGFRARRQLHFQTWASG